jgi:hypothetical protein
MSAVHEPRVFAEGALYWAQASGTGLAWATASACNTALVGFVQVGLAQTSAQTVATIKDRGVPKHHKWVGADPVELVFEFLDAITANNPALMVASSNGASMPMLHFEVKMDAKEAGSNSALYRHYMYGALVDDGWTEAEEGNPNRQTWRFLACNAPTASGYIG